jgi:outer membrane protein assembly factor BamB
MHIFKKKAIPVSTVLLFAISMTASMILLQSADAHYPAWNIPTFSFCSVSPDPIGVGQTARVNFWLGQPPPTANGQYGDRWQNLTVKVTHPDGTIETLGPFISDDTGGTYTTYTPTTIGNYTFQMFFGGEVLAGNNLAPGTPTSGPGANVNIGDYFQPSSSNVFTLVVQSEPVGYPPEAPLPSNYWERPIYGENNNWYTIAGNWLGYGQTSFALSGMYSVDVNYNPYTTAPNTAHIIWTKPEAFGGIIGGSYGGSETGNFFSTSQYEPKFAPIIMNGILYYTQYPGSASYPAGWVAVDLHTGETIWTKNTTELLRCGQIINMITPNQYGGLAYLWSQPLGSTVVFESFGASVGNSLEMWDAMTGNYILTITDVPVAVNGPGTGLTLSSDTSGNLIGYFVDSSNPFAPKLSMWNSTRCINLAVPNNYGGPNVPDNWYWRPPLNAKINFSLGIQWKAPLATNISGTPIIDFANGLYGLGITYVSSGVVYMQEYTMGGGLFYQPGWQIEAGYSADTGKELWVTNRTQIPFTLISAGAGTYFAGDGYYVEFTQNALSISCFSLTTGQKVWGPTTLPDARPFDSLGGNSVIANGTIYLWGYGGDVYAYNLADGTLKWHYQTPSGGYESPYGTEPLWTFTVGTVADGKLFLPEGHMYSPPLFHRAQQLALNITDGSVVWSIDAFDVTSGPAIVDGIMTTLNAYDNQIYAWGKGPTKMTVTAPDVGVTTATPITISGTIYDISAGTKQNAVAANFPNGLPCVSDASMTPFMQAVYMQQQMPINITGVPITLSVLDANGNYRTIGTTTSDASGTFAYTWTPDIHGDYTVTASFGGSESYYPSNAVAHFFAAPTASTPAPTTATGQSMTDLYFIPAVVAIIAVIIIVGIALGVLLVRKKP